MKILHISDSHFHHEDEEDAPVLKRVEALKKFPDHVLLHTGDVTDDGMESQMQKAEESINLLKNKILMLPGNHDYGTLGNFFELDRAQAFDKWASGFGEATFIQKVPVQVRVENVLFILLNSNLETRDVFDFACGKIGVEQLGLLNNIIEDPMNKGLIKIVCLHHHPFIHSDPTMKLLDGDLFMRTIYGKVDVLLFGHKHVEDQWDGKSGIGHILAAGALYQDDHVKEIVIEGSTVTVNKIQLIKEEDH